MIVKHKRDIDGKFNVFNELPAGKMDVSPKASGSAISLQRKRVLPMSFLFDVRCYDALRRQELFAADLSAFI